MLLMLRCESLSKCLKIVSRARLSRGFPRESLARETSSKVKDLSNPQFLHYIVALKRVVVSCHLISVRP